MDSVLSLQEVVYQDVRQVLFFLSFLLAFIEGDREIYIVRQKCRQTPLRGTTKGGNMAAAGVASRRGAGAPRRR
ncbi:hypothetical protein EVAR_29952_1 [Eumeta japonica]|uniref:Uncharacterized protein n=1 Tax=Eumeta variegata TaxID=151549 RepID=A0A4C1VH06_EUMVA|nr:hypothetical protein EVAR_29952_1 [Eumeta japonica]